MNYKRLEIYLGWTCNHKCIFCIEYPTMEKMWNYKVEEREILKKLIKYKKQWYNHVTYLWWEPFIQKNFEFALKVGKKLGYTIMVTTNWSMVQFEKIAQKYLPYIDELIISIPIIDKKVQPIINDTKAIIDFDNVFKNIQKFWKWSFLKVNTVINNLNLQHLEWIVDFLWKYWVKELAFTYPDIYRSYYTKDHILKKMAMKYSDAIKYVIPAFELSKKYSINTKIVDFPFCVLLNEKYIQFTDDYSYQERLKIDAFWNELKRVDTWISKNEKNKFLVSEWLETDNYLPRMRKIVWKCNNCKYKNICWWPSQHYEELFWLEEIKPYL